jgi:DNA replication and repair protein RecF
MLKSLVLQYFRSYTQQKFDFDPNLTIIIGQNTAGKTNLVESIMLLATGKSFRAEKDTDMIQFEKEVARIQGLVDQTKLEVTIAQGSVTSGRFIKKFSVNDVPKSRNHFVGFLPAVLFRPEELEIIIDGPAIRRRFLDDILEQVDSQYRSSKLIYDKALRQRNALLDIVRETGKRNTAQFSYWDDLLVTNGTILTEKREELITFINNANQDVFSCQVHYDKSVMSYERLKQYEHAEVGSGSTLVGPQRDDFFVTMAQDRNVEHFGSRGQQRLAVLQLKLLQLEFMRNILQVNPLLVLDDIFSELDDRHIRLVLDKVKGSQVILTTTHEEFVENIVKQASVIKLTHER